MISRAARHPLVLSVGLLLAACGDDGSASAAAETDGGTAAPDPSTGGADPGTTMGPAASDGVADDTTADTGMPEPLTRIETIVAALDVAMFQCPGRAWPEITANVQSSQVLFVSEQDAIAYLWNDQAIGSIPPAVTELDYASLDAEWKSTFNVGVIDGVATLGISLDETQLSNEAAAEAGLPLWHDSAITLAFHEGMHFLSGQSDWNVNAGSRSLPYPEPSQPRYLRAQTGWALRAQLEAGGNPDLSAAAYWREQSLAEFPDDMAAIASYDITEGSAEYTSAMMSALADLGCGATDEALVDAVVEHLDEYAALSYYSGGREPYDLGVLTGLMLQRVGAQGWQGLAEKGTTMHKTLLDGVDGAPQADDASIQAAAQAAVDARNEIAAAEIEPMIEHMASAEYYRLPLPFDWIAGSFSLGGFYYLADEPGQPELMLDYAALHTTPTGVEVDVTGLTSQYGLANPCSVGAGTIVTTMPSTDLTDLGDGTYTSTNDRVVFAGLSATVALDADGLPWLCPDTATQHAPPPGFGKTPHLGQLAIPGGPPLRVEWPTSAR